MRESCDVSGEFSGDVSGDIATDDAALVAMLAAPLIAALRRQAGRLSPLTGADAVAAERGLRLRLAFMAAALRRQLAAAEERRAGLAARVAASDLPQAIRERVQRDRGVAPAAAAPIQAKPRSSNPGEPE